ncbi:hypothetical protein MNBD_ALPHA01-1516, partial [hydrothermal vent metagenome]
MADKRQRKKPGPKATTGRRKNIARVSRTKAPRTGIRKWLYRFVVAMIWLFILLVPVVIYYAY